mgnify:CR=1 FL=1
MAALSNPIRLLASRKPRELVVTAPFDVCVQVAAKNSPEAEVTSAAWLPVYKLR